MSGEIPKVPTGRIVSDNSGDIQIPSAKPSRTAPPTQGRETAVAENPDKNPADWPYPFSKGLVDSWKAEYGDNVHAFPIGEKWIVVRAMPRDEYGVLAIKEYKTEEEFQEELAAAFCLYPKFTKISIKQQPAGITPAILSKIREVSFMDYAQTMEEIRLVPDQEAWTKKAKDLFNKLQGKINAEKDMHEWFATQMPICIHELNNQVFMYRGLTRSEFDKFRQDQNTGKITSQPAIEEECCSLGILYPYPKNFDPKSGERVSGIVTTLSMAIMAASEFGKGGQTVRL